MMAEWNSHKEANEQLESSIYSNYEDIYSKSSRIGTILECFTEKKRYHFISLSKSINIKDKKQPISTSNSIQKEN